jgi:uncharacterized paraquat-inducible protein A
MVTVSSPGRAGENIMAKAEHATHGRGHKSYAKRISDHVAVALVVYTLALIFITSPAMHSEGTSILPYFMLVVFVALVIPSCHNMEKRWQKLENDGSNYGSGRLEFQCCWRCYSRFSELQRIDGYQPRA